MDGREWLGLPMPHPRHPRYPRFNPPLGKGQEIPGSGSNSNSKSKSKSKSKRKSKSRRRSDYFLILTS
jgi:hypothetical protein